MDCRMDEAVSLARKEAAPSKHNQVRSGGRSQTRTEDLCRVKAAL